MVISNSNSNLSHIHHKVFKKCPNMLTAVDLFHFNFSVNITVMEEEDVSRLDLK